VWLVRAGDIPTAGSWLAVASVETEKKGSGAGNFKNALLVFYYEGIQGEEHNSQ